LGGMHRRLLVAHQDVAQPVLLEERVVDRKDRATGIAEDDLDFLVDQGFHQQIGASRGGLLGGHDTGLLSDKCAAKHGFCGGAESKNGASEGQPKSAQKGKFQCPELVKNFSVASTSTPLS